MESIPKVSGTFGNQPANINHHVDPMEVLDIVGSLMQHHAAHGDVFDAVRQVLPKMLNHLCAEAGSLFVPSANGRLLECVVCHGPVDILGLKVSSGIGLIGRAYSQGKAELLRDAGADKAHHKAVDADSGFVTRSTATVPVQFGDRRFGVMQLINRKANGRRSAFCEADLAAMQTFAASLALALSHLDLAGKLVADHLLKRDIQQAQTAQAALLPRPDPQAIVAGYSVPAQRLSGDFYDYIYKDGRLAFCVGDVAGKGIAAALMMSRIITLFRHLVADGACLEDIVTSLNEAILENAAGQFVTFVAGIYAPDSDHGYLVNCGHLPVILQTPHACISYPAQRVPLGVAAQCAADIRPAKFALKTGYLIVLTDGITESKTAQVPIDDAYLLTLFRQLYGVSARDFVARIASLFTSGQLRSHDDATLLVIHPPANDCHHSTND